MRIEERQVDVDQLQPGMYVCRLDRSWEGTPFPLQGFLVRSEDDVRELARWSGVVFIDVELCEPAQRRRLLTLVPHDRIVTRIDREHDEQVFQQRFEREVRVARETFTTFTQQASVLLDALRSRDTLDQHGVDAAVTPVVAAVTRNQDAYFWLMALKRHSDYAYRHAMNCCALAIAFGRALSYPESGLLSLARGGLLMDIGMASVPANVVDRPGMLHASQAMEMRDHVEEGCRRFDAAGFSDPEARAMLACHHEFFDGSGYPRRLAGTAIPLSGRIAAIVDAFDAMSSDRPYRAAMTRDAALRELYRSRDRQFQGELVEEFVRCLGVYPVGTLVELSSGEIGIVVAQNNAHRLRPRLMLLTWADKSLRDPFMPINLLGNEVGTDGERLTIIRSVPHNSYGLDPTELFL
ncbi:HD-GYP domain-containing protein [Solilutibacter silvestris]|uniref:HD-GYP domain-containing protein n=1 Tax=Solilutibacter silvestris TaxID=1645665 RepID=A0A2K1Q3N3_9GAMM|nr:HD-GYP domain-containing protein [Lysobacter silvestris]PNS09634.1 hypothetical protein Lysil_1263 [Lysobacter silvestris]